MIHNPEDKQADGRWKGTIIQKKVPVREIRWVGFYDKNGDKLYVTKQLMLQSDYDVPDKEIFERQVTVL